MDGWQCRLAARHEGRHLHYLDMDIQLCRLGSTRRSHEPGVPMGAAGGGVLLVLVALRDTLIGWVQLLGPFFGCRKLVEPRIAATFPAFMDDRQEIRIDQPFRCGAIRFIAPTTDTPGAGHGDTVDGERFRARPVLFFQKGAQRHAGKILSEHGHV